MTRRAVPTGLSGEGRSIPQFLGFTTRPVVRQAVADAARTSAIHETVRMARAIVVLAQFRERTLAAVPPSPAAAEAWRAEIESDTDGLLRHMLDSFEGVPDQWQAEALVHQGTGIDVIDAGRLCAMDDALIPLAVMRQLAHRHAVPMRTRTMPALAEFLPRFAPSLVT